MPLEPVWREFFATAAQIEPVALPAPFAQLAASAQQEEHKERQEQLQQQQLQEEDQHQQQPQEQQRRQRRLSARESGDDSELVADQDAAMGLEVVAAVQQLEADKAAARGSQEGWEQLQGVLVAAQQAEHLEATQRLEVALGEGQLLQEAQQHASQVRSMAAPLSLMSPLDLEGVIAQQDLFSVYVHTMPGFFYRNTSIFSGYQIDGRVFVSWGQYTVAEAERRLIINALMEPRNQRFVLVSETCAPLYPPHVFYLQLLSDIKSRVNACGKPEGVERWNSALYMPGLLTPHRWRKSAQWKMLMRAHAQLVATDRRLALRFERECYSYFPPIMVRPPYVVAQNRTWVHRSCISDEHYIPTLLAVHGKDEETTCADALTTADWVPGLWSPKVHHGGEVDVDLLHRLRKQRSTDITCNVADALASAATMFRRRGANTTLAGQPLPGSVQGAAVRHLRHGTQQVEQHGQQQEQQERRQQHTYASMGNTCFLLARKFAPDAASMLLQLGENCQVGTAFSPACLPA
ncbi:Transcription initiation factor TFIID subunit 13 [Micractinium conductrix]|uniref:Transcription initiation factor TFIID subunit 13 n=1 Tax=Micractinium conductrix TaxID=554055 RepID=A0A2P6VKT4_9CHLO|nr:Transcription initiation factor TFIID subunit 13 [Micractinium conductrix]|eukprot:PSC74716.1 Transcription initiation factor TFIID subunit 13 [Micractinium conductrix]